VDNNPTFHERRSIRLKNVDYGQPGSYFVTVCAHNFKYLFGKIILGKMCLNDLGRIVNECWLDIPRHFARAELSTHIVMPNHIHAIIGLRERARHAVPLPSDSLTEKFSTPRTGTIPTIVRSFKSAASKRVRELHGNSGLQVWQRNYYEHLIRNQDDLSKAIQYILQNPARWELDATDSLRDFGL